MKEKVTITKVKTRKDKIYFNDKNPWIGIDVHLSNGYVMTPFGLYKRSEKYFRKRVTRYECDNRSCDFASIKDAKEKAKEIVQKELNELENIKRGR